MNPKPGDKRTAIKDSDNTVLISDWLTSPRHSSLNMQKELEPEWAEKDTQMIAGPFLPARGQLFSQEFWPFT
jgi:hypothetical protein